MRDVLPDFVPEIRTSAIPPDPVPVRTTEPMGAARALKQFSLRFSERKLLLGLFDVLLLNLVFFVVLCWRGEIHASLGALWSHALWFVTLSVVWFACALILGCYDLVRVAAISRSIAHTSAAMAATAGIYLLIPFVTPNLPASRLQIVLFPILAMAVIALWRIVYATVFAHPNFQQRALIVGAGWAGQTLVQAMRELGRGHDASPCNIGYRVVGFIDDEAPQGARVNGVTVVGTRHDLAHLARRLRVDEVVVAITHLETMHAELFTAIEECREWGASITTMADLYERLTGRVPVEHAGRALWVALPLGRPATHRFYLAAMRLLDIASGLLGGLALLSIMPWVALANRLSSPGPLFYCQERVGKGGRTFSIIKFRSMRVDAEKYSGAVWAEENDPRITPLGRFLRKTRLDEMPQFWNILKGDMSLIGPRPERPHFVDQLTGQIPFYRARHAVKPGATGWAQVRYRYGASVEDSLIKLQYDLFYIKHQGVLLDLEILFKTIPIVLGFKGR